MAEELISVVLPCYNAMPFLREAIFSVLSQSHKSLELIIIDDGSTDGTDPFLKSISDHRLILIQRPNRGLVNSLNEGISLARGNYIARMDGDDICEQNRLAIQLRRITSPPHCDIVYSQARIIDQNGIIRGNVNTAFDTTEALEDYLFSRRAAAPIVHPSVLFRKRVFQELDGYRHFTCAEDRDFWLRASRNFSFAGSPEKLLRYRIHSGGLSRTRRREQFVGGTLAIINELVLRYCGTDLYLSQGSLWNRAVEAVETASRSENALAGFAIDLARTNFRSGRWLKGGATAATALLRYGILASPNSLARFTRRLIDTTVDELVRERTDK